MRSRRPPRASILRLVAGVLLIWAGVAGLLVWELGTPHTARGWLLLVGAGPPAYLAVELLGEFVFSSREPPTTSSLGISRYLVLLLVALALFAAAVPIAWLLGRLR